jgi:hypothetical protein
MVDYTESNGGLDYAAAAPGQSEEVNVAKRSKPEAPDPVEVVAPGNQLDGDDNLVGASSRDFITIRTKPHEMREVLDMAEKLGLSMSAFVRMSIKNQIARIKDGKI